MMITEDGALAKLQQVKERHERLQALAEKDSLGRSNCKQQAGVRANKLCGLVGGYDGIIKKIEGQLRWMKQPRAGCRLVVENGQADVCSFPGQAGAAEVREILAGVADMLEVVEYVLTLAEARIEQAATGAQVQESYLPPRRVLVHSAYM